MREKIEFYLFYAAA